MLILKSALLFFLAGLAEIAGGYLVWLWLREHKPFVLAAFGAVALVLYGIIPTFQPEHFGRVYAAYGGVFVVMALLWGWLIDKRQPDVFDWLGAAIVVVGVAVIMYWPRGQSA